MLQSLEAIRTYYSDKERQADLARLARVNSRFHVAAIQLLYARPAVPNEGRATLLRQTLLAHPDLAGMIQRFTWRQLAA